MIKRIILNLEKTDIRNVSKSILNKIIKRNLEQIRITKYIVVKYLRRKII